MRYGIIFTPGDNKRIPGWMQVHYRFQFDERGYPRMYIFSNCKAFIRTIPLMMYSDTKPEDLNTELEDHVADEVRYMCMSRPVKPLRPVEQVTILNDPLNRAVPGDDSSLAGRWYSRYRWAFPIRYCGAHPT